MMCSNNRKIVNFTSIFILLDFILIIKKEKKKVNIKQENKVILFMDIFFQYIFLMFWGTNGFNVWI
jgi:hypothetical protein